MTRRFGAAIFTPPFSVRAWRTMKTAG
jgi:hypothetical protein